MTEDSLGLVATTRDLNADLLIAGYFLGLFPWTDQPVGWFCPLERAVLWPNETHFPRNLGRLMRKADFSFTIDKAFARVIRGCAVSHAHDGIWITPRFERAYRELHSRGHAHSIEVWQKDKLVGGLYGVQTGRCFSAESMFGTVSNASKAAVWLLVQASDALDVRLIDVQVLGPTSEALGAKILPRDVFLDLLAQLRPANPEHPAPRWPATFPVDLSAPSSK